MKPLTDPPILATATGVSTPTLSLGDAASRDRRALADYFELTKPRMNFLVVITTLVGFYLASRGGIDLLLMLNTVLGTTLTAAAASVLNQWLEREHDARMPRTADRPLPAQRLPARDALMLGLALGLLGVSYLALLVNPLTASLGLATMLLYLVVYTPLKRISSLNTVVGAIPGAIPPVMGFTAVDNAISPDALALLAILFIWQMPHFLAIAILYRQDYAAAGYRMLPVVDRAGLPQTRRAILLYAAALVPVSLAPSALTGLCGPVYAVAAVLLGGAFFWTAWQCAADPSRPHARRLFIASVIYLPLLLAAMLIDKQ